MPDKDYLNVGCGNRFCKDWTNIDLLSNNQAVIAYDIRQGLPFSDQSFGLVYHSHVLEHLSKVEAIKFLQDCFRVLRPGGVIRVVVPDLESISQIYLEILHELKQGNFSRLYDYDWIMLEMYDQTVRNYSGGEIAAYLKQEYIPNMDFVLKRFGGEGRQIIERSADRKKPTDFTREQPFSRHQRLKKWLGKLRKIQWRERLVRRLLGSEYEALQLGRFRVAGEIHQWMYDQYSLGRLLEGSGFADVSTFTAHQSYIPNWTSYNLDTDPDGTVYKPDSLYMEGRKL